MSDKTMICRCEDVTLHEVERAISLGHRDLESVKRYTGFGTGFCQGKQCVALCAKVLAQHGGEAPSLPITPRPPYRPVPLAHLAKVDEPAAATRRVHVARERAVPPVQHGGATLPEDADIVVIGGGIMGLATAYNLARRTKQRIVVLEKGYLCSGASGRNGGGIRAQWASETNVRLMKESIELCAEFATEMRINVWFRRGGYLFLARSDERAKQLAGSVELQQACGIGTRMIDAAEAKKIVPELDASRIVAASYNPDDGVVFPWPFVWGYARACENYGVAVHTFTTVTAIETDGNRITGVVTDRGRIRTKLVINAAGAWSPEIAKLVGVSLPNHPHRHEICSTEPLKPFLRPLVADLSNGLYFSQSMRGEIVGGVSNEDVPDGLDQESSARFLSLYAKALTETMPVMGGVRVLRQWAGCYDLTPDGSPIVGEVDEVEGLFLLAGFMGHGFMMAPIMGKLAAGYILERTDRELFERWNLRRFRLGKMEKETMILG